MFVKHPMNGKFIKYGRVSTGSDEQHNSLMVQTADDDDFSFYEEFKRNYNYSCYAVYSDEASGTTDNRKGYQEMLFFLGIERKEVTTSRSLPTGNVKRQRHFVYEVNEETVRYVRDTLKINYILCKNTARWTREGDFKLIQILRNNGIYIYFKDENIDTFSTETDTLLGVIQSLDKNKSQDTSKKVKSGLEASIKLGKVRTNSTIYGFELVRRTLAEPARLIAIPEEAEVVRLIYKLYVEDGLGSRQIANELEKRGIVTRKKTTRGGKTIGGIPFNVSTIKRILTNEKYCGHVNAVKKWDTGEVFNHKSPAKVHDYEIMPTDYIEAIIPVQTFLQAREICRTRSDKSSPRGRNPGSSIYYGKIVCGLCGAMYCQNGDNASDGTYRKKMNCGNKKRHGLDVCDNPNITFAEIDRRYEEFSKEFNTFLKVETIKQKRTLLLFLFVLFEYYFVDKDKQIKEIKENIAKAQEAYDQLLVQRAGLGVNAQRILNERLESVSTQIIAEQEKLGDVYKSTDRFRPLIDRLLNALHTCYSIDITRAYTAEEIKQFDIRMITFPDEYKWEMQFENFQDFLDAEPYIAEDLSLYLNDERFYMTNEELNKRLKEYYGQYGVDTEYYI